MITVLPIRNERPPTSDPAVAWSALLGCPFCGGPAKMLGKNDWAVVVCSLCGASGPVTEGNQDSDLPVTKRQAANKWNKRGNLEGAEEKLKAIAAILNSAKSGRPCGAHTK